MSCKTAEEIKLESKGFRRSQFFVSQLGYSSGTDLLHHLEWYCRNFDVPFESVKVDLCLPCGLSKCKVTFFHALTLCDAVEIHAKNKDKAAAAAALRKMLIEDATIDKFWFLMDNVKWFRGFIDNLFDTQNQKGAN